MARYIQHDLMKNLKQVVNLRIIMMLFFLIVMKINIFYFFFFKSWNKQNKFANKRTSAVILLTKVAPRPLPLGKNQGTETSQETYRGVWSHATDVYRKTVQIKCWPQGLGRSFHPLARSNIWAWILVFVFFKWGWGKINFENS